VEAAEQAEALAGLGCPFGQSYHFARPLPYPEALRLVAQPGIPAQRTLTPVLNVPDVPTGPRLRRYGT
jgi:predicted signal transduction protein with EAL and GGDEF domain